MEFFSIGLKSGDASWDVKLEFESIEELLEHCTHARFLSGIWLQDGPDTKYGTAMLIAVDDIAYVLEP